MPSCFCFTCRIRRPSSRSYSPAGRFPEADRLPLTIGFGPRYLHSTGQIHKGGPDRLVSLILTPDLRRDLPVPGSGYSFGILEHAQAIGDLMALGSLGRRAYALHLDRPGRVREVVAALQHALGARWLPGRAVMSRDRAWDAAHRT